MEENLGAYGCLGRACSLPTHFTLGKTAWGTGWSRWDWEALGQAKAAVRNMGEARAGCQEVARQTALG